MPRLCWPPCAPRHLLSLGGIQSTVAEHCSLQDGSALTLRFGAAELEEGQSQEDLVAAADAALLEAKRAPYYTF